MIEILNFIAAAVLIYACWKIYGLRKPVKKEDGSTVQTPWSEMKPQLYMFFGALAVLLITNIVNGWA